MGFETPGHSQSAEHAPLSGRWGSVTAGLPASGCAVEGSSPSWAGLSDVYFDTRLNEYGPGSRVLAGQGPDQVGGRPGLNQYQRLLAILALTPAGWHPDPQVPGQLRFWIGTAWTAEVQVVTPDHRRAALDRVVAEMVGSPQISGRQWRIESRARLSDSARGWASRQPRPPSLDHSVHVRPWGSCSAADRGDQQGGARRRER